MSSLTDLIRSGFGRRQANAIIAAAGGGGGGAGSGGGGPLGVKRAQVSGWTRSANQIVSNGYTFSNLPGPAPGTPPSLMNGGYAFDVPASEAGWYSMRIKLDVQFTGGTPEKLVFSTNTYYQNALFVQDIILSNGDAGGGLASNQTGWGAGAEIYVPPFPNPGFDPGDGSYYMGGVKLEWVGAGTIGSQYDADPRCRIDVVRLG